MTLYVRLTALPVQLVDLDEAEPNQGDAKQSYNDRKRAEHHAEQLTKAIEHRNETVSKKFHV